jgi:hypothetical protein
MLCQVAPGRWLKGGGGRELPSHLQRSSLANCELLQTLTSTANGLTQLTTPSLHNPIPHLALNQILPQLHFYHLSAIPNLAYSAPQEGFPRIQSTTMAAL